MSPLTPRETEIASLVAAGLGNKAIAAELGTSLHTVKRQVSSILDKIGCDSRVQVVLWVIHRALPQSADRGVSP
jgi:DNA-binding NarL/FixJ family response regulator